jgi:hypothetical protein
VAEDLSELGLADVMEWRGVECDLVVVVDQAVDFFDEFFKVDEGMEIGKLFFAAAEFHWWYWLEFAVCKGYILYAI